MAQNPIIPIRETSIGNAGRILIKSAGFAALKTQLFTVNPTLTDNSEFRNLSPMYNGVTYDDDYANGKLVGPFNVPIFDLVTFKGFDFTDPSGNNWVLDHLEILTCLVEVKQDRHIVKTPIQGRNGTIKEYISDDDYYITINGLLSSNYQDIFPQEEMNSLMQFCQVPSSFEITSPLLNRYFNIHNVIVNNYNFNQVEGDRSNISFQLDLISDPSYEIKLKYN